MHLNSQIKTKVGLLHMMQYMIKNQAKEEFMMKEHSLLLNQLCRGIMVPFLHMDKLVVVRHIPCLVLEEIKNRMELFLMHLTIYLDILMLRRT